MSVQEAQKLRRFRPSRRKFAPARESSLAHPRRPEIQEGARRRVCLLRWPNPFHPDRQVPSRASCDATHHRSLPVSLFPESNEHVETPNAHALYHSRKCKERPQDTPSVSHRCGRRRATVLEWPRRREIFVAASRDKPGRSYLPRQNQHLARCAPIVCRSRTDRLLIPPRASPYLYAHYLSSAQLRSRNRKICPHFRNHPA